MNRGSLENLWAVVGLAVAAVLLLYQQKTALAAPLPVALDPTRFEFTAHPGERLSGTLEFWNGSDRGLPVHLDAADFAPQDEEGHVTVGGEEDPVNSLKAWVKPAYPDLVVFAKQTIHLDFAIDVPQNADPDSHWGTILVSTAGSQGGEGASTQIKIGSIILVRVLGEAKEKLTLESLAVPRFLESPPVTLEARFRNEGTVHEAPVGSLEIRNIFGGIVATGTLPVRNVLPGTIRKMDISAGSGFWLGRYTASLSAAYGSNAESLGAKATFWVVPWKTAGPPFLVYAALTVFLILKRKNIKPFFHALRKGEDEVSASPLAALDSRQPPRSKTMKNS